MFGAITFGSSGFGYTQVTNTVFVKLPSYLVALISDPKPVRAERNYRVANVSSVTKVSSSTGSISIVPIVDTVEKSINTEGTNKNLSVSKTDGFVYITTTNRANYTASSTITSVKI